MKTILCWIFGHKMEPWRQIGWVPKRSGRRLDFYPNYSRSVNCLRCKKSN